MVIMISHTKEISLDYDLIIIGAGPSGCSVANFLNKDYKVLMIDWSLFPRDKPCGGLLTDESVEFLSKIKLPESIYSQPKEVNMRFIDWDNNLEVEQKRNLLNIDRRKFDYFLLNLSKDSIDFFSNTKFLDFESEKNGVTVLIERNNKRKIIRSKYLIGADGAFSSVRRKITNKDLTRYLAIQEWIPKIKDIDTFDYILCKEITDFYSWLIPKENRILIGSALNLKSNTVEKMNLFKNKLREKNSLFIISSKKESALITRPKIIEEIVLGNNNVFLLGEAAGLISPSTGEGISFALRSGYFCAQSINENFENPFENYKKLCEPLIKEIEKKIIKANILSNIEERKNVLDKLDK